MRPKNMGIGRDTAAPSDPNNTGAQGTLMGLSGGSLSQGFDNAQFQQMLGNPGDIAQNPFGSQPNPATLGGNLQQRLDPGEISTNSGGKLPVEGASSQLTHAMESGRTLSPNDTTFIGGEGNLLQKDLEGAPANAVNTAMNAGDADAVTGPDGGYFSNTRKNIRGDK